MEDQQNAEVFDPTRLVSRDGVLGYERGGGFERVTNFDLQVVGYVGDEGGEIVGYIIRVLPALRDPLFRNNYSLREMFLSNRQLGNNSTIIKCLTERSPALWIAQAKDTFLPQYVYNLCSVYMQTSDDAIKRFKLVNIVGKQPNDDIWVFNPSLQIDTNGDCIPLADRTYVTTECSKLPYLWNVNSDLDSGEALRELFRTERDLFQNNYHKVLLTHAASSMAANYHSVVKNFDGCSLPVLRGFPVSGKTTALKAVLSVFGLHNFSCESTSRYIETNQANTTIPFGWDDAANINILNNIAVNSFNACGSSTMKSTLKPNTVPIVTTNLDTSDAKINSRWLRIPFDTLSPLLCGKDKIVAEKRLKRAMENAYKSIRIVTVVVHNAIKNHIDDDDYFSILSDVEEEIHLKYATKTSIDARVKESTVVVLFCLKKILDHIGMLEEYKDVWDTMKMHILPTYVINRGETGNPLRMNIGFNEDKVESLLRESLPSAILKEEKVQIMTFFENDYNPCRCMCGTSVAFHVRAMKEFLESHLSKECMGSINENSIRSFVKKRQIGCTGVLTKFRGKDRQIHAIHIGRSWFKPEDLEALDLKLGKRPTRRNQKQSSSATKPKQFNKQPEVNEEERVNETKEVNEEESAVQPNAVDVEEGIVIQRKVVNEKEGMMQPKALNDEEIVEQPIAVNYEGGITKRKEVNKEDSVDQPKPVNAEEERPVYQPNVVNEKQGITQPNITEEADGLVLRMGKKSAKNRRSPVDILYDKLHAGVIEGKRKRTTKPKE